MESDKHKMIADAKFLHDGTVIRIGDEFEATAQDRADLKAMGFAHDPPGIVEQTIERVTRPYRRRDMRSAH